MSRVIDLLESLGRDASLRHATGAALADKLSAQTDPALLAAIVNADQEQLATLLGAKTNVCCLIFVPEDEEDAPPEGDFSRRASAA